MDRANHLRCSGCGASMVLVERPLPDGYALLALACVGRRSCGRTSTGYLVHGVTPELLAAAPGIIHRLEPLAAGEPMSIRRAHAAVMAIDRARVSPPGERAGVASTHVVAGREHRSHPGDSSSPTPAVVLDLQGGRRRTRGAEGDCGAACGRPSADPATAVAPRSWRERIEARRKEASGM